MVGGKSLSLLPALSVDFQMVRHSLTWLRGNTTLVDGRPQVCLLLNMLLLNVQLRSQTK